MTGITSRKCIDDTNKRFASLFQDIFSTKNYDLIGWLKCIYVSGYFLRIFNRDKA